MSDGPARIEVMHGVNLDMLGQREPEHYGTLTLDELERQIEGFAGELGVESRFFHTNFEGEYVEHLHSLGELVDGSCSTPGPGRTTRGRSTTRWAHRAAGGRGAPLRPEGTRAVAAALGDREICASPSFAGQGPEGYRLALERLRDELGGGTQRERA